MQTKSATSFFAVFQSFCSALWNSIDGMAARLTNLRMRVRGRDVGRPQKWTWEEDSLRLRVCTSTLTSDLQDFLPTCMSSTHMYM